MRAKCLLIAVFCVNLFACLSPALGDGGVFIRRKTYTNADVLQPTQKVYIRWDGSQEKLLVQTKYEGPAEEMVWLVPVPAQPIVEKGDPKVFETLSIRTSTPDISMTPFSGLLLFPSAGATASARASGSTASPIEWRRQIGAYDVVLLRPVAEENVLLWLNSNDFGVPDKAVPILQDYVREAWWMVAAKIHPDALTDITRDKLAQGLLHPLEMTFESHTCLYPLRLTSIAAGPVEELIYIEGPTHYEPVTFADAGWQIDVFGGPLRLVPDAYRLPDIESTMEIVEGRTTTVPKTHLTKLRRVFQPQEMTQDLLFGKMDYAQLVAGGELVRIAEAATQYGRHRDPNGVSSLLSGLSPETLAQVRWDAVETWDAYEQLLQRVRTIIWALGEIALEHSMSSAVEEVLLRCAEHGDERVRMEAYIALTKLGSERLGPILMDRFARMFAESAAYVSSYGHAYSYWEIPIVQAETNIIADWILRFGTARQKDTIVEGLQGLVANSLADLDCSCCTPERSFLPVYCGTEWLVWRAACTQDQRLIGGLEKARTRLAGTEAFTAIRFLQRAEAACGSLGSKGSVVRDILEEERAIVPLGPATPTDDIISLYSESEHGGKSLRGRILERREIPYELFPMTREVSDATIRSAISMEKCCPWYTFYLLARIKKPQAQDRDRLLRMGEVDSVPAALVAVDVLYVWGDWQTLMRLYAETQLTEVKSEIAWALAGLGIPQAAAVVEGQLRDSWNPRWIALPWPCPRLVEKQKTASDRKALEAARVADAAWSYFHPEFTVQSSDLMTLTVLRPGVLDDERLATLKRLVADHDIHPGVRFDLIGSDYATTDWGKPLFREAAAWVLQVYPDASAVRIVASQTSHEFVVDVCAESISDESLRTLLLSLLTGGDVYHLPVIQGLLWQVWPQRYRETQGQSILFREPGDLASSVDYYCQHATQTVRDRSTTSTRRPTEPALASIVNDDFLPAGYRAFLLVFWPTAPGWFSPAFVERLLKEDMPDFIREALQKRLLDWRYVLPLLDRQQI